MTMQWITCDEAPTDAYERTAGRYKRYPNSPWIYVQAVYDNREWFLGSTLPLEWHGCAQWLLQPADE